VVIRSENGVPTIVVDESSNDYGSKTVTSGKFQPSFVSLITSDQGEYEKGIFTVNWDGKNFYSQYTSDSFDSSIKSLIPSTDIVSDSEKNKGFEVR
jgi:hypothetical protein